MTMMMVMNRRITVNCLTGHCFAFERDVPQHIPDMCLEEVMSKGAIPAEGEEMPKRKVVENKPVPVGLQRRYEIFDAYDALVAANERGVFTAAGSPNIKEVCLKTGFKVDEKEHSILWGEYKASASVSAQAEPEPEKEEVVEVVKKKVAPKKKKAVAKKKSAKRK